MSKEHNPFYHIVVQNSNYIKDQAHYLQQHNREHSNLDIREAYKRTEKIAQFVSRSLHMTADISQQNFIAKELNNWLQSNPLYSHIYITGFTLSIYEIAGLEIQLQTLLTQLLCTCFNIDLPKDLRSSLQTEWLVESYNLNDEDVI